MTSFSAPLSSGALSCRPIAPTRVELLLLRASHAVEAFTLRRMQRRATAPVAATDAVEARRTAQALGAAGIMPR